MHTIKPSQHIDTIAEKIVAVRIRLDGTLTPILRHRISDGRVIDADSIARVPVQTRGPIQFVARVRAGDSGVLALPVADWDYRYGHGVIPLGRASTFAHEVSSLDVDPVDGPAESPEAPHCNPDEVWFRLADGKLGWKCGTVSGVLSISAMYRAVDVVLRLPPGHHGEIRFASPLFNTAAGEPTDVLSVA